MKSAIGYCKFCKRRFFTPHVEHYSRCKKYLKWFMREESGFMQKRIDPPPQI